VAVSTSLHEFFGIAAIEAVYCGCYPLWPNRLTYPEFLPAELHPAHLYEDHDDLVARLRQAITDIERVRQTTLREHVACHDWRARIAAYDDALEAAVDEGPRSR
jgi:hypothetical protein